jgi:MbtH protein
MSGIDDEDQVFLVVVNGEGQYSVWPEFKPVPAGWTATGFKGVKKACLDHVAQVWSDMRPASLRRALGESD